MSLLLFFPLSGDNWPEKHCKYTVFLFSFSFHTLRAHFSHLTHNKLHGEYASLHRAWCRCTLCSRCTLSPRSAADIKVALFFSETCKMKAAPPPSTTRLSRVRSDELRRPSWRDWPDRSRPRTCENGGVETWF